MKKIHLLLIPLFVISCSSDDEELQDIVSEEIIELTYNEELQLIKDDLSGFWISSYRVENDIPINHTTLSGGVFTEYRRFLTFEKDSLLLTNSIPSENQGAMYQPSMYFLEVKNDTTRIKRTISECLPDTLVCFGVSTEQNFRDFKLEGNKLTIIVESSTDVYFKE